MFITSVVLPKLPLHAIMVFLSSFFPHVCLIFLFFSNKQLRDTISENEYSALIKSQPVIALKHRGSCQPGKRQPLDDDFLHERLKTCRHKLLRGASRRGEGPTTPSDKFFVSFFLPLKWGAAVLAVTLGNRPRASVLFTSQQRDFSHTLRAAITPQFPRTTNN